MFRFRTVVYRTGILSKKLRDFSGERGGGGDLYPAPGFNNPSYANDKKRSKLILSCPIIKKKHACVCY